MTYSRKGPDSCKRSVLKDTRPVVEQDAHFFVIRWMRICVGLTFMVSVQRAISALSSSFVNTVSPFYRLLCQPAIPLKDLHLPYLSIFTLTHPSSTKAEGKASPIYDLISIAYPQYPPSHPCLQQGAAPCRALPLAAAARQCSP